jgi:hypothetical protein
MEQFHFKEKYWNIMLQYLQHPVAHHLLFKSLLLPPYIQHVFLTLISKFLHITLHISTGIVHRQAFKIVDENCCASVV